MSSSLLRFTLDLFSPEALPPAAPAAPKPPKADAAPRKPALVPPAVTAAESDKKAAPDQLKRAQTAPESIATGLLQVPPAQPRTLADACPPANATHPRANREALLGTLRVGYEFRRGKRRTIGFSVGPDGLTVSAPKWLKLGDVDQALQGKAGWIVKKLQEVRAREEHLSAARIVWQDGAVLPFLGRPVRVVLDPGHRFAGVGAALQLPAENAALTALTADPSDLTDPADLTAPVAAAAPHLLYVGLPHGASAERIRDVVQAWLMRQASCMFTERLQHFAPQLGVQWRTLSLSNAGTRWGSASADGSIRLHWRLVHFRQPVIDYVVVHELSHLRVMNHSPLFWETVRAVVPDYAGLRGELKGETLSRW